MGIELRRDGAISVITVDYPKQLNALNKDRLASLRKLVRRASSEPETRAIVLTGGGKQSFIAGADISSMADFDREQALAFAELGQATAETIATAPQPVIAAVNGFALGGGCELACACDIRLAAEQAVFAQPEVGLGILPGWGGTVRLPNILTQGVATDLILTGRKISAEEALRIGLVSAVHPRESLLEAAVAMARDVAAQSPDAVRSAKRLLGHQPPGWHQEALSLEAARFAELFEGKNQREGMTAFLEKRSPTFIDVE